MNAANRCHMLRTTLMCLLFTVALGLRVEAEEPQARVSRMLDSLLSVLQDETLKMPEQSQERRERLHQSLSPYFDFTEMARRSLGHHWDKITPAQQQEYIQLFSAMIEQSFVDRIAYRGEMKSQGYGSVPNAVQVTRETIDPKGFASVQTKMTYPDDPTKEAVEYLLLKRDENWFIYDVVGDGASTLTNYRTQFNKIIRRESYDDLINRLKMSYQHRQSASEKGK
jgi:phospholipid transport system substrate-binding protein